MPVKADNVNNFSRANSQSCELAGCVVFYKNYYENYLIIENINAIKEYYFHCQTYKRAGRFRKENVKFDLFCY